MFFVEPKFCNMPPSAEEAGVWSRYTAQVAEASDLLPLFSRIELEFYKSGNSSFGYCILGRPVVYLDQKLWPGKCEPIVDIDPDAILRNRPHDVPATFISLDDIHFNAEKWRVWFFQHLTNGPDSNSFVGRVRDALYPILVSAPRDGEDRDLRRMGRLLGEINEALLALQDGRRIILYLE